MKKIKNCLCMFLVLLTMLSVVAVSPDSHVHAASPNDFISETYASNLSVKTTKTTSFYSYPITGNGSTVKQTVPADTVVTVKALHKNTKGEYWYEISYFNLTLYVEATSTKMISHLTGDISLTGNSSPASLTYGNGFPIKGDIKAQRNDLGKVTVSMYKGQNITVKPALTASANVNGKSYCLTNSSIDVALPFSDLSPGSYNYVVSAEAVSYYINEKGAFSTSKTTVILHSNICAITNGSSPNPVLHNGIDISVWNGDINWSAVKSQVDFVIIRASWEETADTKFTTNANGCVNNDIPFGVYVYSYAENEAEAIGEAKYVLSLVDNYDMDLPIFFDFEDECAMGLSASTQQKICRAFCDTIIAGGRQPGIYTYTWILRTVLTDTYYRSIPMWTAEINGASYTSYKGGLWMWQWSWVGRFNGMNGDVDCNKMYVELPGKNSSDKSYLSKCTAYPSNLNVTVSTACNVRQYPSTDYTQIGTYSVGTKLHVTGLYKNSYGNYWYQVEKDGVTGYIGAEYVTVDEYLYNDVAIRNPKMASNLDVGKGFYIEGVLSSVYNKLGKVHAKVYSEENTQTTPAISSTVTENSKRYSLYKSTVDYGLNFSKLAAGYYTYEVSSDVTNYYVSNGSLTSKTQNVVVWRTPFTVGAVTVTPPESTACVHEIKTLEGKAPTCTTEGLTTGTSCSKCGEVITKQEVIPATGHSYDSKKISSSCLDYEKMQYTCAYCGDTYTEYAQYEWLTEEPSDYSDKKYETKIQYRYSDYSTVQNNQASLSGYTQVKKEWKDKGSTTIKYVKSWPSGYDTSNSLYKTYNVVAKSNSENATTKITVTSNSSSPVGYLYYHWCEGTYQYGPVNFYTSATKTDVYSKFHAFYDTKTPESLYDPRADDGSVPNGNADACKHTYWYYNVPVYSQTYTTYEALYTHGKWSDWSAWSDTQVTASDTRKVETRELYRQLPQKGEHRFSRGKCLVCDFVCEHNFSDGKCEICKMSCMHKWETSGKCSICNQPCSHSWQNGTCTVCGKVCEHNWSNGSCSLCGKGCAHNWKDGVCINCSFICSPHAYVNGVCSICSTACPGHRWADGFCAICNMRCIHEWKKGVCTLCDEVCEHNWKNGSCLVCSMPCEHDWNEGKCSVCQLLCKHNWQNGVCIVCDLLCKHDSWHDGMCTNCALKCEHNFKDGVCTNCKMPCPHKFEDGICTDCGHVCTHDWDNGICLICDEFCEHNFENGVCTICGRICIHRYHEGICLICDMECEHSFKDSICEHCGVDCLHNWVLGACTLCMKECEHKWYAGVCEVCGTDCNHNWKDSTCTNCTKVCEVHYYTDGSCAICSKEEPAYYLAGFINGKDYGIGEDIRNIGKYKFESGTLQLTFESDSYVVLKTQDNTLYMTNGYQGDNTTVTLLYKADVVGEKGDKLFVPGNRDVTFTLIDNGNGTITLSYTLAPCEHKSHTAAGYCTVCKHKVEHTFKDGFCTVCSLECEHTWKGDKCTVCGLVCTHNFESNNCTFCGMICTHNFYQGVCTVCSKKCVHTWTDGACPTCGIPCDHNWRNGTCARCHLVCEHKFTQGVCSDCGLNCAHEWHEGTCSNCKMICDHNYIEGVCSECSKKCEHSYNKTECTLCGIAKYYLVGEINGASVGYNYDYENLGSYPFVDGELTLNLKHDSYLFVKTSDNLNWYMTDGAVSDMFAHMQNTRTGKVSDFVFLPGGVNVTFTIYTGKNDTLGLIYSVDACVHKLHNTDGICLACEQEVSHVYSGGRCTVCSKPKPVKDMYLFGVINGEDYGYNGDASTIGEYKFVNGKLTVEFTQDSYVAVKSADNADWYMTNGAGAEGVEVTKLFNTLTGIDADMFCIPGGQRYELTLINNGDDTFTLSYESLDKPKLLIKPKYTTLSLDKDIRYKVCFTIDDPSLTTMSDMGLITFDYNVGQATIDNATQVISGVDFDGTYLSVSTDAIHPKTLGDVLFFRVYAKLYDGSYAYSDMMNYSAVRYANSVLGSKNSGDEQKTLMVALLNYGAEAQEYYGYKTDSLVNSNLTVEQKKLVSKYSADLCADVAVADNAKTVDFAKKGTGFTLYPSTNSESSTFNLTYNLRTNKSITGYITLYYWDAKTYASASKLTKANATGILIMSKDQSGNYTAELKDISVADFDDTVYTSVMFKSGAVNYCTGVISYSYAEFLKMNAENFKSSMQSLAQAIIVYSYYADKYCTR